MSQFKSDDADLVKIITSTDEAIRQTMDAVGKIRLAEAQLSTAAQSSAGVMMRQQLDQWIADFTKFQGSLGDLNRRVTELRKHNVDMQLQTQEAAAAVPATTA